MTDFIRRLVSGNKARFKDGKLNLELDLVYVTASVIIMGYPASGIEGIYRNRREDARKFLLSRHGTKFWVFNFCPVKENSYPSSVFDGRVSRYPFPDHHPPPLALLPLATREMHIWLRGAPDRVVVLHCKAGKGRSGTLACGYLLSLEDSPTPPRLERSYSAKQWAEVRADELMQAMPDDDTGVDLQVKNKVVLDTDVKLPTPKNYNADDTGLLKPPSPLAGGRRSDSRRSLMPPSITSSPISYQGQTSTTNAFSGPLKNVLDLHTSQRMKAPSPGAKTKQGVSIPSQRRWLYYWSLLLAHQGPPDFWPLSPVPTAKVRITEIKVRMNEMSGLKTNLVKAVNFVIGKTGAGKGNDHEYVWASLARYNDELVDTLEMWEQRTRDEGGNMGRRNHGSEHAEGEELADLFADQRWDNDKMVRSFARMGSTSDATIEQDDSEKNRKIVSYTLRPFTNAKRAKACSDVQQDIPKLHGESVIPSEATSMADVTQTSNIENGIVLDAGREVRVKLYIGQVLMGWTWFIPIFHVPQPLSAKGTTRFLLTRKELDFPLGVGSAIADVEISLQTCEEAEADRIQPPAWRTNQESPEGTVGPAGNVTEAVEEKQATGN